MCRELAIETNTIGWVMCYDNVSGYYPAPAYTAYKYSKRYAFVYKDGKMKCYKD